MSKIFLLYSATENKGEWTVMSLQGVLVLRSNSQLRTPQAEPKQTHSRLSFSHHVNVSISGKMPSSMITLTENNDGVASRHSSTQLDGSLGSLNRDRKGQTTGPGKRSSAMGPSESCGQCGNPQRSGQGHKGHHSGGRDKKRVGASTYWKHGQPTASTTAFFWSWLWFDALLKFHKYSNVKKKIKKK